MIVYRAMCEEEYLNTLKEKQPVFIKRFKWFSHNLNFIKSKVKDGKFNNSQFVPDRYKYVLSFKVYDIYKVDFITRNEVQVDRRKNVNIQLIGEVYD